MYAWQAAVEHAVFGTKPRLLVSERVNQYLRPLDDGRVTMRRTTEAVGPVARLSSSSRAQAPQPERLLTKNQRPGRSLRGEHVPAIDPKG